MRTFDLNWLRIPPAVCARLAALADFAAVAPASLRHLRASAATAADGFRNRLYQVSGARRPSFDQRIGHGNYNLRPALDIAGKHHDAFVDSIAEPIGHLAHGIHWRVVKLGDQRLQAHLRFPTGR